MHNYSLYVHVLSPLSLSIYFGRSQRRPGQPKTAPESARATQGRPRELQGIPRGRQKRPWTSSITKNTRFLRCFRECHRSRPERSKRPSGGSQKSPRRPQDSPRGAPKRPQEAPRGAQEPPRSCKKAPRSRPEALRRPRSRPGPQSSRQEAPRRPPGAAKTPQGGPQEPLKSAS